VSTSSTATTTPIAGPDVVAVALDAGLAEALGPERVARWQVPRAPYLPEVRSTWEAEAPTAAILTSRRPATAAVKLVDVWWAEGAEHAAEGLVRAEIAAAQDRGDAVIKWELPAGTVLPGFASGLGFEPMRAPYSSASGTEGVHGAARWLLPMPHAEVPYYAQTTLFTCGAVAALLAVETIGESAFDGTAADRDLELSFWRQASNYPACEPIGLAVALRERLGGVVPGGAAIEVALDADGPVLLESYPDGFEREFRERLQAESVRRAGELDLPIRRDRVPLDEVARRVREGELALLLIDEQPMHGETGPHWVLAHAAHSDLVVIQDPWISAELGETWVDTHDLPVPVADLDRMLAWGPEGHRGVVFLAREPGSPGAVRATRLSPA
jgi:hypothetical protein